MCGEEEEGEGEGGEGEGGEGGKREEKEAMGMVVVEAELFVVFANSPEIKVRSFVFCSFEQNTPMNPHKPPYTPINPHKPP